MPKTKISEYSTTNSQNTDIQSINIDEGCAPSGINNAIRELMVHLRNFQTNASGDGATLASLVVQGTGSFTGSVTLSGGATLSGTNTLSGSNIMSGNINSSGTNTFSGSQVISGNINSSGSNTFSGYNVFSSTGAVRVPIGTEAQRPASPTAGMFRFNDDADKFEGYNGTAWGAVGGGATGAGGNEIFYENGQNVTASYTITTNKNAMSTGPITVDSGVTVTVPSGSRWVVL